MCWSPTSMARLRSRWPTRSTAQGGTASVEQVDVRDERSVSRMADAAHAMGPVRVLVLSAAVETRTSITDCSDEEWREVVDTNLKGPFLCMRACIPLMCEAGGGSVIAMGCTLGLIVAPQYPAYSASKFALTNLCKQAAIEHAPGRDTGERGRPHGNGHGPVHAGERGGPRTRRPFADRWRPTCPPAGWERLRTCARRCCTSRATTPHT